MPSVPPYKPADLGVPFGFCPDGIPPYERQARTSQFLREAAFLQIEIMLTALKARTLFERWAGPLLSRHWQQAFLRWQKANAPAEPGSPLPPPRPPAAEAFRWSRRIATLRSTDLYMTKGDEGPAKRNLTLSIRACHLEAWVFRYLAIAYRETKREAGARSLAKAAGFTGGAANTLVQRLLMGATEQALFRDVARVHAAPDRENLARALAAEAGYHGPPGAQLVKRLLSGAKEQGTDWDFPAIADGIYNLLDWNYIARVENYCDQPELTMVKRYVRKTLELFDAVIRVNRPAAIGIAKVWHDSARIHRVHVSLDDLIATTSIAINHAACRYNWHWNYTFAGVAKAAINSHLRRSIVDERCIRIPEEGTIALQKHNRWLNEWRAAHADEPLPPLEQQLALAGVRVSARCFAEMQSTARTTSTLSLHEIGSNGDSKESFASDVLLSDQGAGAKVVRGDHDNPATVRLRRIFRRLPPLYQGILNCFAPCAVTDGGDEAFHDYLLEMGEQVVAGAARNAQRSVTDRVAGGIELKYH
jgi:DNA-directed RNA polymerase specialized sigma subunit